MKQQFAALKAETMMKIAGFIFQNHKNPILKVAAKSAAWINRKQYGHDALDFLEHEDSIDHLDYSDQVPPPD